MISLKIKTPFGNIIEKWNKTKSTLFLGGYGITQIPPNICEFTNLIALSFTDNNLTDISQICTITTLTDLILGFNELKDVRKLKYLLNLVELQLHDNKLKFLPLLSANIQTLAIKNNQIIICLLTNTEKIEIINNYDLIYNNDI